MPIITILSEKIPAEIDILTVMSFFVFLANHLLSCRCGISGSCEKISMAADDRSLLSY
jgi:hypothetical protein